MTGQEYLKDILEKFNANNSDSTLSDAERLLLQKTVGVEKEINNLSQEFVKLNNEIKEKQDQMNQLNQKIVLKRGQSQGFVESLLVLRPNNDVS